MKKVITLLVALAASWASYAQTDLDTTFDEATVDDSDSYRNRPLLVPIAIRNSRRMVQATR
jgi:hypothetical protein